MKCKHCGSKASKFKIHPSIEYIFFSNCGVCLRVVFHELPQHISIEQLDKYMKIVEDKYWKDNLKSC
jgi:hypothetical protein